MIRFGGMLCACLLLAPIGCAFNVGNTRVDVAVKVDEQAVDATLEGAAAKIQAELQRRGLSVAVDSGADTIHVVSTTKAGNKFTVVLTRSGQAGGKDQTRVRVEWEKVPDRDLWLAMLVAVGTTALETPH